MTDAEFIYNQTNRERAITRRSASHKKNGCRSKKCKLEVDKMSAKQIEEQHGPVKSWNMNTIYTWDEVLEMPDDIKVEYFNHLMTTYNVGLVEITKRQFKLSHGAVYGYATRHKFNNKLHKWPKGFKPRPEDVARYAEDIKKASFTGTEPIEVKSHTAAVESFTECETMEFSTSYTSSAIDYDGLKQIERLFSGKRIRVTVTIEAV